MSPFGVAVNPAGTLAYVANLAGNSVSVINLATNAVIATIGVGASPFGVAVNPAGTLAYVTYWTTIYALAVRNLVAVDRRHGSWSAGITDAGRFYL